MRPNPRGLVDPTVRVLWAIDENAKPFAVLFSYACHPTTAGALMEMGGDYCGMATLFLEEAIDGATALFLPGCFGDVRPRVVNAEGNFAAGTLEVVRAFGHELCFAVLSAMSCPEKEVDGALRWAIGQAHLPFARLPSKDELETLLSTSEGMMARWAKQQLERIETGTLPTHSVETVQVLRIGDLAFVGLSGEVCVGYQLKIAASRYPAPTFVVGCSNAVTSYIPTAAMFPEGGYEVSGNYDCYDDPSPLTPECETLILDKVEELLRLTSVP